MNLSGVNLKVYKNLLSSFLLTSTVLDRVLVPGATITSLRSAASECIVAVNTLTRFVGGEVGFARLLHVLPYAEAIGCRLPRVLLEIPALSGNRRFAAAVCFLWRTLHCIMPRRFVIMLFVVKVT